MILGIANGACNRNSQRFSRRTWILVLWGSFYLQFCCACLAVFSGPKGSTIFAALLIFAAGYHGHNWRITVREFFFPLGTIIAALSAVVLNPSEEKLALLSVVGFIAAITEVILGTNSRRWSDTLRKSERIQAAFQAQLFTDQSREVERLSETLIEVFGRNHDLNNALMATNLYAEIVLDRCRATADSDLRNAAVELESSLSQVNQLVINLVLDGRRLRTATLEEVDVRPIVDSVRLQLLARFPAVRFEIVSRYEQLPNVLVRGGPATLRRIVENLLINACEGDGRVGAERVELHIFREPSTSRMKFIFRDDGPGFSPEQLTNKVQAFITSKPHGTGLGLYTSERLVMASGGTLVRENHGEGGARISVSLPLDDRSPL
jgi:two-component system C4-dicarboxylate transport sensor histidine kinase DctB